MYKRGTFLSFLFYLKKLSIIVIFFLLLLSIRKLRKRDDANEKTNYKITEIL